MDCESGTITLQKPSALRTANFIMMNRILNSVYHTPPQTSTYYIELEMTGKMSAYRIMV